MNDKPRVSRAKTLSPVWFIPLLALLIAGWLAFNAWQASGQVIQIEFKDAAGIAVGKTHVRYRDVAIGQVKKIQLSDDFTTVQVLVEMDPHVDPLITDRSNFWVVSPRISLSGISGIETLLSGVYIEMDSGRDGKGEPESQFVGLEQPPSIRSYDVGNSYQLTADTLGSLDIGSPVYHRQVPVGEITSYQLLAEQDKVQIRFFVKSPHNLLITEQSQFWNVSGLDAGIGPDGFNLHVSSLNALIAGGVEFDTPPKQNDDARLAEPGHSFYLFSDRDAVSEGAISVSYRFLLRFSGSVRGLKVGAPVEYLGIQIGQVERIRLNNATNQRRNINVLIAIQPERMSRGEIPSKEMIHQDMAKLVREGMQAKLNSGGLIGGALFVDLRPNAGPGREMDFVGRYPELPTAENEYSQISRQLASIVERVHNLPIEAIGADLQASLKNLRSIVEALQQANVGDKTGGFMANLEKATDGLDVTLSQLEQTLRAIDQSIAPDSALSHRLTETLKDISDSAKSMELLTDELYRYPNALLRGKEADQ